MKILKKKWFQITCKRSAQLSSLNGIACSDDAGIFGDHCAYLAFDAVRPLSKAKGEGHVYLIERRFRHGRRGCCHTKVVERKLRTHL